MAHEKKYLKEKLSMETLNTAKRLKKVDLPTFGRPTTATIGFITLPSLRHVTMHAHSAQLHLVHQPTLPPRHLR